MSEEKNQMKDLGQTTIGMQPNLAGVLCYLVGFVSGIIFYLIEKENKFVRFHAMQSIIVSGSVFVLQIVLTAVPFIGPVLSPLVALVAFILWLVLMIKAYQGEFFKLPIAGEIAQQNS